MDINNIFLLVLFIIAIIITIFIYMIIFGANITKTDEERLIEDEEELKYLRDYNSRRKISDKKNK